MRKFVINFVLLIVLSDQLAHGNGASAPPNMIDYYKMPKLSIFDDYDKCFQASSEKMTYCVVDATIRPDNTSNLWRYIKNLSDDHKHNFRHDRLQRGVCIKWCEELMQKASNETNYYLAEFEDYNVLKYDPRIFRNSIANNIRYSELVNQCVNYKLSREHNLWAHSTIEYCLTNRDVHETDSLNILFIVLVVGILLTTIASSCYDHYLTKCEAAIIQEDKIEVEKSTTTQMLTSFSLQRNWRRLMRPRTSQEASILDFVDPLRFMTMLLVASAHTVYYSTQYPVENPDNIESIYYSFIASILLNGYVIVQSFFVFSGLMQAVGFISHIKKHKTPNVSFIWNATLYRYLRLTPVYVLLILFHSTYNVKVFDGPFWPRLEETQRYYCRKNWWANLLYINNYVNVGELCMLQSWYLSADFQLFVFCLGLLYVIWRYPQYKFQLLSAMMAIGFVIPGIITYVNGFEGVVIPVMEHTKFNMIKSESFQQMYTPTHTNMGCYLIGLSFGFFINRNESQTTSSPKRWFHQFAFIVVNAFGLLVIMSGYIFYEIDFEKPSIICGIYAAIQKHVFGLGVVYILWCLSHKFGSLIRKILNFKLFHTLGKLTYCAFLVHIFVIQTTFGFNRQPIYIRGPTYFNSSLVTLVVSYTLALVLSLLVEFPTSALQKIMFSSGHKKPKNGTNNNINMASSP